MKTEKLYHSLSPIPITQYCHSPPPLLSPLGCFYKCNKRSACGQYGDSWTLLKIYFQNQKCHIITNLLTKLARSVLDYQTSVFVRASLTARSILSRPRSDIFQYRPRARLITSYQFSAIKC